jgi:hypothetical protein
MKKNFNSVLFGQLRSHKFMDLDLLKYYIVDIASFTLAKEIIK